MQNIAVVRLLTGLMLFLGTWGSLAASPCPDTLLLRRQLQHARLQQRPFAAPEEQIARWRQCGFPENKLLAELYAQAAMQAQVARPRQALQYLQVARDILQHQPEASPLKSMVWHEYGRTLRSLNFPTNQVRMAFEAFMQQAGSQPEWQSKALMQLAYTHTAEGEYATGLDYARRGLRFREIPTETNLKLRLEKCHALLRMQLYDSLQHEVAAGLRAAAGQPLYLGLFQFYNASNFLEQEQFARALPLYRQATYFFRKANAEAYSSICEEGIAICLAHSNQYREAQVHFSRSYHMQSVRSKQGLILSNWGRYWFARQQRYETGLLLGQWGLKRLLPGFEPRRLCQNPDPKQIDAAAYKENVLEALHNKPDIFLEWGRNSHGAHRTERLECALATYLTADRMVDYLRWQSYDESSKLFWRKKAHRLYGRAIETCFLLNRPQAAVYFFEKSRAVLLNEYIGELGATELLSPALRLQERILKNNLNDVQERLAEARGPRSDTLLQLRQTLQKQQRRFLAKLQKDNPRYYLYKYDTTTIGLGQIRARLLADGQQFVYFFIGDEDRLPSYALLISHGSVQLRQLPIRLYRQQTEALLAFLSDPDRLNARFPEFLQQANRLYRQLISPLQLQPGRVMVSMDGPLVPLEVLSRSATEPQYLLSDYAFSYAYSARILLRDAPAGHSPLLRPFLGVAPVQFSPPQVALPGSDRSLQVIGSHYVRPTLLIGSRASARNFLAQVGKHQVVHLYTHAEGGQHPRIYFNNTPLVPSDLARAGTRLHTQLVVLAACNTGTGHANGGEGVFSLARGFAGMGIPAALITLWNVDNQATYELCERFYDFLRKGTPPDLALQQARLRYLAQTDRRGQLPVFWGGLVMMGRTEPLPAAYGMAVVWAGVTALVLVVGVVWAQRRWGQ